MIYRCPYCRVNVEISSEHHANFPCPLCGRRFCSFCETPVHFPAFCGEARVWYAITEARPANASFPIQSGLRYYDNTERLLSFISDQADAWTLFSPQTFETHRAFPLAVPRLKEAIPFLRMLVAICVLHPRFVEMRQALQPSIQLLLAQITTCVDLLCVRPYYDTQEEQLMEVTRQMLDTQRQAQQALSTARNEFREPDYDPVVLWPRFRTPGGPL